LKTVVNVGSSRTAFLNRIAQAEEFEAGEGIVGEVLQSRKPLYLPNVDDDSRVVKHSDDTLRIHSLIATPIVFRDKTFGVLCMVNPTRSKTFSKMDFSLAQSLSEQAGMIIHSAHLVSFQIEKNRMDFDLQLAQNIQRLLLIQPEDVCLPRTDIAIDYRSAQKVGGDLYHVVQISETKFAVFIADVSGKGIPASLLMTMCMTHLNYYALCPSPREVLLTLNRHLHSATRKDMFVTMLCAVVDVANNTILVANAGHEPLILFNAKASVGILRPKGMALGMVDDETFRDLLEEQVYPLAPNDGCVLYTDGITEALNSKEEAFSQTHLVDVVRHHTHCTAEELNRAIMDNIRNFSSTKVLSDDLTLISIRRL
jgi:sigma-B regulation protein RsbU (phosphoserine phosphatase)